MSKSSSDYAGDADERVRGDSELRAAARNAFVTKGANSFFPLFSIFDSVQYGWLLVGWMEVSR